MQDCFKILQWDSNFFNFKVAEIEQNFLSEENTPACLKQLAKMKVDLVYYTSTTPLEETANEHYDFVVVNEKVPIKKKLSRSAPIHEKVSLYDEAEPNQDLFDLVQRAARFSRFLKDPNIDPDKVVELYHQWMYKSVKKEIAAGVLVYKSEDRIKGFITVKMNPPHGETPILAVDRNFEGRGVSFALMRAADSFLYDNGCSHYTSATQAENKAALTVFKRHGFEIKPVEYTYHLWRK